MASEPSTIIRTRTFRAYLSRAGHGNLDAFLHQLTGLWNLGLEHRKRRWAEAEEFVSFYDQCKALTVLRRPSPEKWGRFAAHAQRSTLQRLHRSYQHFFRKGGFPRFKGAHRGVRSFSMPYPKIRTNGNWSWVKVKGVGRIRFKGMPEGTVKLVRVVRTARRINIQFVCEQAVRITPDTRPAIGLDLGINARVALSSGERFPGVKIDRSELKRRQRKLAKAMRGSRNRRKRKAEHAREWQKVREREKGALHELTTAIVRDHSAHIAVEDLQTRNLMRNRRLARSIGEQQWGRLVWMLGYKAESAGGSVTKVDPRFTSQDCSRCGHRKRIDLAVRLYRCQCEHQQNRDVNAACNILQRATGPNPGGASPGTCGYQRAGAVLPASA